MFNENGPVDQEMPVDILDKYAPLRIFLQSGSPREHAEKVALRQAFVDSGLFVELNRQRRKREEDAYANVSVVPWDEMKETLSRAVELEKNYVPHVSVQMQPEFQQSRMDESTEAEISVDHEQGEELAKFEPMSQGPKESEKQGSKIPLHSSWKKGARPTQHRES